MPTRVFPLWGSWKAWHSRLRTDVLSCHDSCRGVLYENTERYQEAAIDYRYVHVAPSHIKPAPQRAMLHQHIKVIVLKGSLFRQDPAYVGRDASLMNAW